MASKNSNPYREESSYAKIFDYIRHKQVVTRQELLDQGFPVADITVIMSPRAEGASSREGDPRGSLSAHGHLYYMEKLQKEDGAPQRFRLRWRATPLERKLRSVKVEKASQKSEPKAKAPKVPKAKVEKAPKAKAAKSVKAKTPKAKAPKAKTPKAPRVEKAPVTEAPVAAETAAPEVTEAPVVA